MAEIYEPTDAEYAIDWPMPLCPICASPLVWAGKGLTHWYECPEHGPQDPKGENDGE